MATTRSASASSATSGRSATSGATSVGSAAAGSAMLSVEGALKQLHFSAGWPQRVAQELAALSTLQAASAGETLFLEGQPNDRFALIVAGRVGIDMHVPGRGRLRILSLGPGDVLAWSAVLGAGPMTATGVAEEPCSLLVMSGARLRQVCEQDHEIGYYVMERLARAVSRRLLATRLQLLDIFSRQHPPVDPRVNPDAS